MLRLLRIEPRIVRRPDPVITMSMRVYREKTGKWEEGPPIVVGSHGKVEVTAKSTPA